jgi:hypothetical protein
VSRKEVDFLRVAVFFELEVVLGQAADNVTAPIPHNNIDIDEAAGEANGPAVGQILCVAPTRHGERQEQIREREKPNHASHRL